LAIFRIFVSYAVLPFGSFGFFKGFTISLPWTKRHLAAGYAAQVFGIIKFNAPMHGNKCGRYNFGFSGGGTKKRKGKFQELNQH